MNLKTLQYWHKLEHFYPYILNEQNSPYIKTFSVSDESQFPDLQNPAVSATKIVRRYAVYLGIFRMDSALRALENGMQKPMKFQDAGDDESCFCMFTLSSDGVFEPESFRISSFPWAIHRVSDGNITIDKWDDDFNAFEQKLFHYLKDNKEPCTYTFLETTRDYFASQINWNLDFSECWLRVDMILGDANLTNEQDAEMTSDGNEDNTSEDLFEEAKSENENTDELVKQNDLLNSFYVRDLERIIQALQENKDDYGQAFEKYITHDSEPKVNVESDTKVLFDLMSPAHLPFGRWPSKYGMRFMQQVDVSTFLCKDSKYQQALFSVNGPPGTGKTTLLKDIIAAIIVERAMDMAKLDTPDSAFGKEICQITYRGFTNRVRDIIPPIKNHGIVVASNNNGAVENITNELPSMEELPEKYRGGKYHYFSEVSDMILGKEKTWALNAASLGNKRKRSAFIEKFWPLSGKGDEYNLNQDLREKIKSSSPERWNKARQSFAQALEAVKVEYVHIKKAYCQTRLLLKNRDKLATLAEDLRNLESQIRTMEEQVSTYKDAIANYTQRKELLIQQKADLNSTDQFLWLKKLVFPNQPLVQKYKEIVNALTQNSIDLVNTRDKLASAKQQLPPSIEQKQILLKEIEKIRQIIALFEADLEVFRTQTDSPYRIDEYFTGNANDGVSKSSPWGYSALNILREQLFLEALQLHKAFIYNSKYLRENLDAFGKMMRGKIPAGQLSIASPILLQSLFLIVPVVSTTFASVSSFLRDIPKNEIAYLFVDEAGQATPQSAAGAVWRAKKVIAVGDPLQIEPVVTLHDTVIQALAEYYHQSQLIADKYTSMQSLADLANTFGGYREFDNNKLWIGAPLVVHNRCQRQVFRISNKIAYDNKMVYATEDHQDAVCQWIHVSGSSQNGHFVINQAKAITGIVLDSFKVFAQTDKKKTKLPSLFLITPFRSVRAGMANHFRKVLPDLLTQKGIDISKEELRKWISTSIGTIHTFQGKQADIVILCLGVGSDGKNIGAVNWASERPNILNVAVTRAKVQLYIVGDKNIWSNKSYFDIAYRYCCDIK
ncbi:DEAD/DEAH box helicase [Sporomusa rhizae]|uniref:DEAD/DEAH box helicase n=1 Tax=Sporomusa rhizae TaxID=357999 RepID=UPI00352A1AA8